MTPSSCDEASHLGFAAADGKSALDGARLAIEQANAAGGIAGQKLELVVYDDQASPKEAVPAATRMVERDKVIGAVAFKDCTFLRCNFFAVGFTGAPEFLRNFADTIGDRPA